MADTRVKLTVAYDGTGLSGWQRQINGPTIQQHLEEALAAVLGEAIAVTGASRTDAGVHAAGQVVHFDWGARHIPLHGLVRALNSALPDAITVRDAVSVDDEFHARFSAAAKDYRYVVDNGPVASPLLRRYAWWVSAPLSLEAMRDGARHLIGEHDFAAFRASGCQAKTTIREILGIRLTALPDSMVCLDIRGNAFLRNMVRIIAGTLVEVGRGRLGPSDVGAILASRDRTRGGQTAPARGLVLRRVHYTRPTGEAPPEPTSIM